MELSYILKWPWTMLLAVLLLLAVLKPVPVNSAWSRTDIWIPRSTFYDAWELSYTLKWPWIMLLMYTWKFWKLFESTQHGEKHISGHQEQPSTKPGI